jgi:heparosan-N-sulfate-glucuronate 5-epimerase
MRQLRRSLPERLPGRGSGFELPPGRHVDGTGTGGYYVDFSEKADAPVWPPPWFPYPGYHRFMAVAQYGLGCYERHLSREGDGWLDAAKAAGEYLLAEQTRDGGVRGGWAEPFDYPHTYDIRGPWLSAMAQGQSASLLVRLFRELGDERFAAAARLGLEPMRVSTRAGGVRAELAGGPFPEEYPTDPPAHVLNGAIFSLWGYHDVGSALDDEAAQHDFREGVDVLAGSIERWDAGYWSRYDLYPHVIANVASPAYHTLHVNQLRALEALAPHPDLRRVRLRFERYSESRTSRGRAFARKAAFRILIPRNRTTAQRLPWNRRRASDSGRNRRL